MKKRIGFTVWSWIFVLVLPLTSYTSWANYLTSLSLTFLTCKLGIIILSIPLGCVKIELIL